MSTPPEMSFGNLCGQNKPATEIETIVGTVADYTARGIAEGSKDDSTMEAEVKSLDYVIRALSKHRSRIQRELNHRNSLTSTLPSDVLTRIFEWLVPSHQDLYHRSFHEDDKEEQCGPYIQQYPHILSRVCVRWREIVLSAPILWSSLVLTLSNGTKLQCAAALKLFLTNSSPLPFHLELTIIQHTMPSFPQDFYNPPQIEHLLFESMHSPRISGLYLTCAPWKWLARTHIGALSCLRNLRWSYAVPGDIDCERDLHYEYHRVCAEFMGEQTSAVCKMDADQLLYDRLSSLEYLSIRISDVPNFSFPRSHITILSLSKICTAYAIRILHECPQLEELYILENDQYSMSLNRSKQIIRLPRLRVFLWQCCHNDFGFLLLDSLQLPCLEKIATRISELPFKPLKHEWCDVTKHVPIVNFFERLPLTVTHFELSYSEPFVNLDHTMFPLSNLRHLSLWACLDRVDQPDRSPPQELSPPCISLREIFQADRPITLPNLSTLVVYPVKFKKYCVFQFPPSLMDLIEGQERTYESPFNLILGGPSWNIETADVGLKRRYCTAQAEGKLKISYRRTWQPADIGYVPL